MIEEIKNEDAAHTVIEKVLKINEEYANHKLKIMTERYIKLIDYVKRVRMNTCCLCCDPCLTCDATELLRELGECE